MTAIRPNTFTSRTARTSSSEAVVRSLKEKSVGNGSPELPGAALGKWIDRFVDFLVTKHGLAAVLQSGDPSFDTLHVHLVDRLPPVAERMLGAAIEAGEIRPDIDAYGLMRGVGNLCIGDDSDDDRDRRGVGGAARADDPGYGPTFRVSAFT